MAASFTVFIDESGDDGFVFKPNYEGSSRWLCLSATVIRKENEPKLLALTREARTLLGKPVNHALHFHKLKHEQRVAVCSLISKSQVRGIAVLAHKPSIPDPEKYQTTKNRLYHYLTRILLERVSWLCRDSRIKDVGDGTADIVFSNRASMSYDELREYFVTLEAKSDALGCTIDWSVVRPQNVRSEPHESLSGLQVSDFVASGIKYAAELNRYGHSEAAYIKLLKPILYRRNKALFGYGLKFYPDFQKLKPSNPHLEEFDGL